VPRFRSQPEIEHIRDDEQARIQLGRRGQPEDFASWGVALVDPSSWVTGQVIGAAVSRRFVGCRAC